MYGPKGLRLSFIHFLVPLMKLFLSIVFFSLLMCLIMSLLFMSSPELKAY